MFGFSQLYGILLLIVRSLFARELIPTLKELHFWVIILVNWIHYLSGFDNRTTMSQSASLLVCQSDDKDKTEILIQFSYGSGVWNWSTELNSLNSSNFQTCCVFVYFHID